MAIPTWIANGTGQAGAADLTVNWPSAHVAGDLGLLVVISANQLIATPSGWTQCTDSPQSTGTGGAAGATRLTVFWKLASSSAEAAATVTDSGSFQAARIVCFRGTDQTTPFDVTAGDVQAGADTSVEIPGDTTTVADCLIVLLASNATDVSTTEFGTTWTNAALASITSRSNTNVTSGVGGGYTVVTAEKAAAGAFGATTGTLVTASAQARIMLALKPPAGGAPPGFGGLYVAAGVKAVAGAIGASTATLNSSVAQGRLLIALKPPTPVTNTAPTLATLPDLLITFADEQLDYPCTATDPEGDTLTFSLHPGTDDLPGGLTIDASGNLQWIPLTTQVGTWNVTVRVTDTGGLFDEQNITIRVFGTRPTNIGAQTGGLTSIS